MPHCRAVELETIQELERTRKKSYQHRRNFTEVFVPCVAFSGSRKCDREQACPRLQRMHPILLRLSADFLRRSRPAMFNLMPKDPAFYDNIEQLAALVSSAVDRLVQLLDRQTDSQTNLFPMIERDRHDSHILTRELLRRLDQAFITPFDREDIMQLANDLYGVIESIANAAERLCFYPMKESHPDLRSQCTTLNAIARQVDGVVLKLRKNDGLGALRPQLDEIGRLEEQSRSERTKFLSELYRGTPDPLEVMKKKELHDLIVEAIRACDRVGRTIERVLLKNG
jgi:uncharacterized protein Yka (UPF0111/DUF47 family)